MAHFAKLDENNIVVDILVVDNKDINDLPFPESEAVGVAYLNSFLPPATYKQTSYNNNFRVRYAAIGNVFLPEWGTHGAFAEPQPALPSLIWDDASCAWIPPVPMPDDGVAYRWDEDGVRWVPEIVFNRNITVIG